jgi:hypothetical protein
VQREGIALLGSHRHKPGYESRLRLYESGHACRGDYTPVVNRLRTEGKLTEVEALQREQLAMHRVMFDKGHPTVADSLYELTRTLLALGKSAQAESSARECLEIREIRMPDDWRTHDTRSLLGASLLGQTNFARAEPLLVSGYEGMMQRKAQIPEGDKALLREALERLVQLYTNWGQPDRAAEWKRKLTDLTPPSESS